MKAKDTFEETKIKMVMKLRGLTRKAAVKALQREKAPNGPKHAKTERAAVREAPPTAVGDLFGDSDGDVKIMSAEEFFRG